MITYWSVCQSWSHWRVHEVRAIIEKRLQILFFINLTLPWSKRANVYATISQSTLTLFFIKHMLVVTILKMVVHHQANHCITLIVFCFWSFTGTNTSMQGLLAQSHFPVLQKQLMFSKFPNFTFSFIICSSIISSCWIRQGGSYAPQLCFSKLFDSIKVKNKVFELALICLYYFLYFW